MQEHLIWQMLQCEHILILIMHFHAGKFYCGVVLNVHISILLTEKKKTMNKQYSQLGVTFITSLEGVLLMVEFH